MYSDVEFIIPSRRGTPPKKIYAIKKMLERWDYFEAMSNGGFGEEERAIDEDVRVCPCGGLFVIASLTNLIG